MPPSPSAQPSRMLLMPPPALRGLVRYFHVERGASGRVLLPATPNPMVTFFLSGGSFADKPDGSRATFSLPFACGPTIEAFYATWLPGTSFITAVCEPATFGELLGLDILDLGQDPQPLAMIAPALATEDVGDALCRSRSPGQAADIFSAWLLRLASAREQRIRGAFQIAGELLFAPSPDIAAQYGLSVRQI